MTSHISCDCKCKFNSKTCNSHHNYRSCKKDYSWNPSTCICKIDKYIQTNADNSIITCDEIISGMDILSTRMTNTIATIVSIKS